ncbi:MAG: hypothetical protein B7X60_01285 [Polynucleobacter sp. 39-45-136]|jgi:hypothetical protein|nr:MAG: hypothetical protein B7X60_01285 [Polynucleobacter sp. 39-45-136]
MTENIWIEGIELVRVKRLAGENGVSSGTEERQFRRAERDLKEKGVMRVWYDENDLMTCEKGAVYARHGRRFVTQNEIDEKYPSVGSKCG